MELILILSIQAGIIALGVAAYHVGTGKPPREPRFPNHFMRHLVSW